ncbi:hypothetical protein OBBRIDRAFT_467092 [Obba rivulosa]|uniref:Uncharacterized protein n=1 Tax=Obba rivulosa TaxID=1052685 RepID=A0A8E2B5E3_9APHY|nr:hypothetical protein OBBRIDRAFT_467092 [Obba rivulosa]
MTTLGNCEDINAIVWPKDTIYLPQDVAPGKCHAAANILCTRSETRRSVSRRSRRQPPCVFHILHGVRASPAGDELAQDQAEPHVALMTSRNTPLILLMTRAGTVLFNDDFMIGSYLVVSAGASVLPAQLTEVSSTFIAHTQPDGVISHILIARDPGNHDLSEVSLRSRHLRRCTSPIPAEVDLARRNGSRGRKSRQAEEGKSDGFRNNYDIVFSTQDTAVALLSNCLCISNDIDVHAGTALLKEDDDMRYHRISSSALPLGPSEAEPYNRNLSLPPVPGAGAGASITPAHRADSHFHRTHRDQRCHFAHTHRTRFR